VFVRQTGGAGEERRPELVDRGDDPRLDRVDAQNRNEPRDARFVENPMDRRRPVGLRR
jgi:hypothetical protein